jgi:flagellar motor switch protein FliN/FliY
MANTVSHAAQSDLAHDPVDVHRPSLPEVSSDATVGEPGRNLDLILDISVPVTVELGRASLKIQDLLDLQAGAVVELDRMAGSPVDVIVNGKLVAQGEVVVVDESFGVRITSVVEPMQRIRSLDSAGVARAHVA